jgi:hypothetical protein
MSLAKEWGSGVAGAEKRAASLYGQSVVGDLIERGVKAIDKENTRYLRLGAGTRAVCELRNRLSNGERQRLRARRRAFPA